MFINEEHEKRYKKLKHKSSCNDSHFNSLMYVIAGNEKLYSKANSIYNFKENNLNLPFDDEYKPYLNNLCLSTSEKALLKLGIQMYNSILSNQSVFDTFYSLDEDNCILAMNCIKIRFNIK